MGKNLLRGEGSCLKQLDMEKSEFGTDGLLHQQVSDCFQEISLGAAYRSRLWLISVILHSNHSICSPTKLHCLVQTQGDLRWDLC